MLPHNIDCNVNDVYNISYNVDKTRAFFYNIVMMLNIIDVTCNIITFTKLIMYTCNMHITLVMSPTINELTRADDSVRQLAPRTTKLLMHTLYAKISIFTYFVQYT